SLSGHTSGIDSVTFDSSEVLVAAGAASGTIKLWDLEEAKVFVWTLTGHRSNCISVDFHPFGEFFASGSLDTNLKIWDIRKKGCIHTYKGHTRGVNAIRFTPDGRWVVSGGEDNIVKVGVAILWVNEQRKGFISFGGLSCCYYSCFSGIGIEIVESRVRLCEVEGYFIVLNGIIVRLACRLLTVWDLTAGKLLHQFKDHE
ncbi:hypothetical protein Goari_026751, partial [Gossypium aridum]|nr:hypothetical protein [Gossypium aridum]